MPQTSTQLVVPDKIVSAFTEVSTLPDELSKYDKPEPGMGKLSKLRYGVQKTALINGPLAVTVALGGNAALFQAGVTVDPLTAITVAGGAYLIGAAGSVATLLGLSSLFCGDRCFTPFRPTKKFLQLREKEQTKVIQPFDSWDAVFEQNNIHSIGNNQ